MACLKSFPPHLGRTEREKRKWGGVYGAIWDEIRGERRKSNERESGRHGRERRDE